MAYCVAKIAQNHQLALIPSARSEWSGKGKRKGKGKRGKGERGKGEKGKGGKGERGRGRGRERRSERGKKKKMTYQQRCQRGRRSRDRACICSVASAGYGNQSCNPYNSADISPPQRCNSICQLTPNAPLYLHLFPSLSRMPNSPSVCR